MLAFGARWTVLGLAALALLELLWEILLAPQHASGALFVTFPPPAKATQAAVSQTAREKRLPGTLPAPYNRTCPPRVAKQSP